ncbi:hypothetical protein IE077_000417 [Cardiosporidium cionae]|uniref:RanBD1 domain-containing protein n=1 Tax=Cardiosporidium cionae TaxID=476202 RepID=A0ABQ7J9S7_9APIC|nr:hypothetical protein IE077_000417 [Cardiosporidium cionae]|eukprot:KAF8820761.1 hypothetical protein IE077_000417 [Cardiosporidium cionae]
MAKRTAEFQLTKELSVPLVDSLSPPKLEKSRSCQDKDEITKILQQTENESEMDRPVRQKIFNDENEEEITMDAETEEQKDIRMQQKPLQTDKKDALIDASAENPGPVGSLNLPKASILTESTEFRNPFTLYVERGANKDFFMNETKDCTTTSKAFENSCNDVSFVLTKDTNYSDSTHFSMHAAADKDPTAMNAISTGSPEQVVYFTEALAKFSRYNRSESGEWILPIGGKLTIAGKETIEDKSPANAPHITFHQNGTGRLLLNTDILKTISYRVLKQKTAMFIGRSIGDASQLSLYRITFSTGEKRNSFIREVERIQHLL